MTPPSSPVLASTPVPISRASKENSNPTQNELRSIPRQLTSASAHKFDAIPTSVLFPPPSPSSLHAQSPPVSGGHGFTVVRNFLTSCRPSMEKYLYRFIDFGCKTEEYLSSIAAWDPERRDKVLKKILSQSNGTPLGTEMDIEVLQTQFEACFP
ncbi:hypothetical protein CPB84DRAFT_1793385 [Gymnopilus junonius]|uniref:Uncharacterized protein n=1 Tax=Gymnopilus junonius TaxID=109634 RepID=A0A9P5NBT5_GYMJU|nr:hypothetical protein CPB84DRAFT_1793385 [Gymnopilus junonius]